MNDRTALILEEFLGPQELAWLWSFAMNRSYDFAPSQVINDVEAGVHNDDFRRSIVLYDLDGFHERISARIMHYLPHVLQRLQHAPFQVSSIEAQLTASNDGEFFKPHVDCGQGPVATREITFVYFCHREPQAFSGGELKLYDSGPALPERPEPYLSIRPTQNTMVFFRADRLHEISTVSCPSRAFPDSRFTLNGWLHR